MASWTQIAFLIGCNILVAGVVYGRLRQEVTDLKRSHYDYVEIVREHQEEDHKHVTDTDAHWNPRDRFWLDKRIENMEMSINHHSAQMTELLRRIPDPDKRRL